MSKLINHGVSQSLLQPASCLKHDGVSRRNDERSLCERDDIWSHWQPDVYYNSYYGSKVAYDEQVAITFQLKFLEALDGQCERALEFGCGPTLLRTIAACRYVRSMDLADKLTSNLAQIQHWVRNDECAYDWRHFTEYILEVEGGPSNNENIRRREKLARTAIRDVIVGDAFLKQPLFRRRRHYYDLLLMGHCIECATDCIDEWRDGIRNVLALLRPGGALFMSALHYSDGYLVGSHWFPSCNLGVGELCSELVEVGVAPSSINVRVEEVPEYIDKGWSEMILLSGRKYRHS